VCGKAFSFPHEVNKNEPSEFPVISADYTLVCGNGNKDDNDELEEGKPI
jgi:hypothetical protein